MNEEQETQEEQEKFRKAPSARFRVTGKLDTASGRVEGEVTISRGGRHIFTVRRKHHSETFSMPLDDLADYVCQTVIYNRVREKQLAKKRGRRR